MLADLAALNATVATSCNRGLIWHYRPKGSDSYVWEVVRFEDRGNRSVGIYSTAAGALGVYRAEVETVS